MSIRVTNNATMVTGRKKGRNCLSNHTRPFFRIKKARLSHPASNGITMKTRNGNEKNLKGNWNTVDTGQDRNNWRKSEDHNEIIHRHLSQRVRSITVGEIAPDEDHRRAWSGCEND